MHHTTDPTPQVVVVDNRSAQDWDWHGRRHTVDRDVLAEQLETLLQRYPIRPAGC